MASEGFQLNAATIADEIHDAIVQDGSTVSVYFDAYVRPAYDGSMYVTDPVDRAVVVFVGSRQEAAAVAESAKHVARLEAEANRG